jgi:hypothetical protein
MCLRPTDKWKGKAMFPSRWGMTGQVLQRLMERIPAETCRSDSCPCKQSSRWERTDFRVYEMKGWGCWGESIVVTIGWLILRMKSERVWWLSPFLENK